MEAAKVAPIKLAKVSFKYNLRVYFAFSVFICTSDLYFYTSGCHMLRYLTTRLPAVVCTCGTVRAIGKRDFLCEVFVCLLSNYQERDCVAKFCSGVLRNAMNDSIKRPGFLLAIETHHQLEGGARCLAESGRSNHAAYLYTTIKRMN